MHIRIATTEADRAAVFALRTEVFVDEQKVPPELELDAQDAQAVHILAEENGIALGCARILFGEKDAHIGRLAVKKAYRGRGIGQGVCLHAIGLCRAQGILHIWLNAQLHAAAFYERLGFRRQGEIFPEAGIEHIRMEIE